MLVGLKKIKLLGHKLEIALVVACIMQTKISLRVYVQIPTSNCGWCKSISASMRSYLGGESCVRVLCAPVVDRSYARPAAVHWQHGRRTAHRYDAVLHRRYCTLPRNFMRRTGGNTLFSLSSAFFYYQKFFFFL